MAQAQAEGLVLVRAEEGEGNSGFVGVEHVTRSGELQDCPYKATHESRTLTRTPTPTPTPTLALSPCAHREP